MMGHIFQSSKTPSCHSLFQVDCRMTKRINCSRNRFITSIQYLYGCYPHHTTIQCTCKTCMHTYYTHHTILNSLRPKKKKGQGLFYVEICFNSASHKHFLAFPSSKDLPCSITFIVSLPVRPLPQLPNEGKFTAKILTTSPRLFHFLYTSKTVSWINPHHYSTTNIKVHDFTFL